MTQRLMSQAAFGSALHVAIENHPEKTPMSIGFDGFYATYLTAKFGSAFGMFVFKDGVIIGADLGGGKYDGSYAIDSNREIAHCLVNFVLPSGQQSITGAVASTGPIRISVPVALPTSIDPAVHHRIETAIGPLNARFEKLRGFEA